MAVTGLANLAVKVADITAAAEFYRQAGAVVGPVEPAAGGQRVQATLGPLAVTLFTRALYEEAEELPPEGFLHAALFTDDLDAELAGHDVVLGPTVIEGSFGRRRVAFVRAPGGIRLEFIEQLAEPPPI
ncbi:MAG: VOC family protein [Mycobacteriales bacterium]